MKNKDQILLENIYFKILKEEGNKSENEELFVAIAAEFLSRSNPSDKIFNLLNDVKSKGIFPEFIDFLNQLGEEDGSNWVAKDKLIEFLFQYYS